MAEGRTENDGINSRQRPFYPEVLRGAELYQVIPVRGIQLHNSSIPSSRGSTSVTSSHLLNSWLIMNTAHVDGGCCRAHNDATGERGIGWSVAGVCRCSMGEDGNAWNALAYRGTTAHDTNPRLRDQLRARPCAVRTYSRRGWLGDPLWVQQAKCCKLESCCRGWPG